MDLLHIDHITLRVTAPELAVLHDFYTRVLGLRDGPRPDFPFPGHWLYCGGAAVVHLAGNQPAEEESVSPTLPTGRFNHVSLRTRGLATTRAHLQALNVEWAEASVPGVPLHQIFLRDPIGLKVELTFDADELAEAGPSTRPLAY